MTEIVSFPGLGLDIELNRIALEFGNFKIYWYGILAATGIMLGLMYVLKRSNQFGLNADKALDVFLYGAVGGLVGARAYYVIFSWDQYKDNLMDIFKIWNGGIAIYGGMIGGFLVGIYVAKKKNMKVLPLTDVVLSGFLLGQSIGRWGNFVNVEAFGSNTTLPWGMTSPSISAYLANQQASLSEIGIMIDPSMPVHPTFFYESIWCFIGFIIVALYANKRKFDGELTLFYCVWYGSERFVVEGLRTDSLMIGDIRVSQMLSGIVAVAALIIWIKVRNDIKKKNDLNYLIPYGKSEEYKAELMDGILSVGVGSGIQLEDMVKSMNLEGLTTEEQETPQDKSEVVHKTEE